MENANTKLGSSTSIIHFESNEYFLNRPKQLLDTQIQPKLYRNDQDRSENECNYQVEPSIEDSMMDLRNRSEILPSISRYNSVNLKTRNVDPDTCIFSPSKYDTIDTEEDEERLLVFSED